MRALLPPEAGGAEGAAAGVGVEAIAAAPPDEDALRQLPMVALGIGERSFEKSSPMAKSAPDLRGSIGRRVGRLGRLEDDGLAAIMCRGTRGLRRDRVFPARAGGAQGNSVT